MRIDFYHVDAFEVATYEPIWRALRSLGVDARLVGPPDGKNRAARGWFDHGAFVEACCGRRLPFETEADPGAVGVTTQNTEIVAAYRHPHIRLMYGPVMYPSAWGLSQHAASRFDCILAHGPYYQRHLARWKREWQTPVVGYPRYDDYFAGKLDLAALRRKHGVDHAKPILLYLPTWAENSSFDQYFEIIAEAGNRFQVIVRPHHCTARFEPQRMERLRASGARLATGPFDLPELLAVADLVVADARSCSLLEAIMCGRRVLGLASVAAQDEEWMRATGLAALSPCCHSPERFGEAVERCLAQPEDNAPRAVWRDEHVAFRDGSAANRAAQAILTAIERTVKSAAAPARPAPRPAVATRPAGAPRVSVVLPTYNHLRFLPAAIQSVLDQTYTDFELIIVNDGSTDGTRDYLERLRHPRIRVLHQQNQRLPRALNTGFRAARGDLLTWVSSDNSCAPIFLEALVGALDAWPEAGMAVSAFASIDPEGRITGIRRDQDLSPACLFTGNPGIAAFLYRREYQQAVGEYDPALEGAEDWDLWVRLSELAPVVYVPEILYYYRRHDATMTSQIPARVRESSLQVIPRALERCQHQLNLDKLYPAIAECSNREHAEAEACFDLGTNLLWSPYAPADLAVPFLKAAFEKSQVPGVLANLALALARAGHWEDLAQCLPHLGQINQPAIQEVFSNLSAALKRRQPLILTGPPPFGLTSTTSELLARTLGRRRVYSLTMAFSDAKNRDAERGMPPQASRPEAVESRKSLAVPVDSSGRTSPAAPEVSQSSLATSKSRAEFMAEAQACLAQGELEATRDVLEEALASSPGDLEVRETLGNICFQVEDFEAASRHYRFVTERQPRTADAWLRLAHAAHRNDQIEEFEHALGRVLALEPEHRDAQKFLGDLNLENGLNLEAVLAYKRVLRQTPNDLQTLLALGVAHYRAGQFEAAQAAYERILGFDAGNQLARENLTALRKRGQQASGVSSAVELPPVAAELLGRADAAYGRGDLSGACGLMAQVVGHAPRFVPGWVCLGNLQFQLEQFAQSREAYSAAQRLQPENVDVLVRLAAAAFRCADINGSELALRRALELDRDNVEALRLLGSLNLPKPLAASGEPRVVGTEALSSPAAASKSPVVSGPDQGKVSALPQCAQMGYLAPGRALLASKQFEAAWAFTQAALRLRPYHPEAYLLLADIALAAGDSASALRCAREAARLAPQWKPAQVFLNRSLSGDARPEWLVLPPSLAGARDQEPRPSPRLSVCLIVKNEEQFLARSLASARPIAHQVVVVDTGSSDRTVEIAKEHGAEVFHFAWCDDFSAARNVSLEHATGDWILVMDADEELPAESHRRLRQLMDDEAVLAWRLPIIDAGKEDEGCSYVPRLFRNAPAVFFIGRVHEQAFSSLETRRAEWGLENRLGDAPLRHHGYRPDLVLDRNKIERNLRLLEQAIVELPDDPNLLMSHGLELCRSGATERGLEQYFKAVRLLSARPPGAVAPELRETLLSQLATQLLALKRHAEIVSLLGTPLARNGGMTASLYFALGLAHLELKQFSEAADQMRQCLSSRNQASLAPINKEIRGAAPRHCLALCLEQLGQTEAASEEYRQAVHDDPGSRPARLDHAGFLAAHARPVEALNVYFALTREKPGELSAWLQGGRVALSSPQFLEVALDWTAEAIQRAPRNQALLRQRAEALTLAGDCAAALPFWRELSPSAGAPGALSSAAALALCESVVGDHRFSPPADLEAASGLLISWNLTGPDRLKNQA